MKDKIYIDRIIKYAKKIGGYMEEPIHLQNLRTRTRKLMQLY